jgi:hypothetical protein
MHENRETSETPAAQSSRPAGEGSGRTTRMHVPEESDRGIVPMNHSNKIEQSMTESEEGRPLIEENTHQASTRPTQSGARVSPGLAGVRKASSRSLRRQSSEIRAVCANERSYGSARGAISDNRPYRDLTDNRKGTTWTNSRLLGHQADLCQLKRSSRKTVFTKFDAPNLLAR